jgi:hypothetical protein
LAPTIGADRLAWIREVHTVAGTHRVCRTALTDWVSPEVRAEAGKLSMAMAYDEIGRDLCRAVRAASRRAS